jgi:hypothetical protein
MSHGITNRRGRRGHRVIRVWESFCVSPIWLSRSAQLKTTGVRVASPTGEVCHCSLVKVLTIFTLRNIVWFIPADLLKTKEMVVVIRTTEYTADLPMSNSITPEYYTSS